LRRVVLNTFSQRRKASSLKQVDFRDMLKKTIKGVCTSTVVVCPDHLFPIPLPLKNMKIPENTEEDSYDPKPAGEGYIQMKYACLVTQPQFQNSNKKVIRTNVGQYRYLLIIWHLFSPVDAGLTEFYCLWMTRPL